MPLYLPRNLSALAAIAAGEATGYAINAMGQVSPWTAATALR